MKTTLEISDTLLNDARKLASREGTTLRALVEQAFGRWLPRDALERPPFKLRDGSFEGKGLQPEFADGDWDGIRRAAYEGGG
jgi:hypothetical protein